MVPVVGSNFEIPPALKFKGEWAYIKTSGGFSWLANLAKKIAYAATGPEGPMLFFSEGASSSGCISSWSRR
eukprot:2522685-Lingulodinium_polyedra.AAC.1